MASRSRRRRKALRNVGWSAVVVVAAVIVAALVAGRLPAQVSGPETRTVSVRKETPPRLQPMTTVTQQSTTSSLPRRPTTTTVVPGVTVRLPDPMTRQTPTTTRPAPTPRPTIGACLALADANNYEVIAANETWFEQQLRSLAAHRISAGPQFNELQIEEAHTLLEIDAEYTIDKSNCYLR
jgi:hypothetical protein